MKNTGTAIWAEYIKIRKSKILAITIIIFIIIPLMMGLMIFVTKNPEIASKLGMIGTKANMFGQNEWSGYFGMISQALSSVGLIGFGFVTSYVFGREHIDRALKDILSLPVKRSSIVLAKFIIIAIWCTILAIVLYIIAIIMGKIMNLEGWSTGLFWEFTLKYAIASLLTLLLSPFVAAITGYSRGIIAPLGFIIFTMILAQFVGLIGLGPYFPWAIPGLFSVGNDSQGLQIQISSYIILAFTFVIGYWATVYWWKSADHH